MVNWLQAGPDRQTPQSTLWLLQIDESTRGSTGDGLAVQIKGSIIAIESKPPRGAQTEILFTLL